MIGDARHSRAILSLQRDHQKGPPSLSSVRTAVRSARARSIIPRWERIIVRRSIASSFFFPLDNPRSIARLAFVTNSLCTDEARNARLAGKPILSGSFSARIITDDGGNACSVTTVCDVSSCPACRSIGHEGTTATRRISPRRILSED